MKKLTNMLCAGALVVLLGSGAFVAAPLLPGPAVLSPAPATAWAQPSNSEGAAASDGNAADDNAAVGAPAESANGEVAAAANGEAEVTAEEAKASQAADEGGEGVDETGVDGNGTPPTDSEQSSDGSEDQGDQAPEEPQIDPNNQVNPQQMPDSSFLYDTSIAELAAADPYMNNQTVQVVGEAIGDILAAVDGPNYAWVMLQEKVDNDYPQISVLMTRTQSDLIDNLGRYGVQGTKLQVRGQFHLSCPQHDGLTDLHAESVTVVARGSVTSEAFDVQQFLPGLLLFVVAGVLLLVFRRLQEGQR